MAIDDKDRAKAYRERKKQRLKIDSLKLQHYENALFTISQLVCIPAPNDPVLTKVCQVIYEVKKEIDLLDKK